MKKIIMAVTLLLWVSTGNAALYSVDFTATRCVSDCKYDGFGQVKTGDRLIQVILDASPGDYGFRDDPTELSIHSSRGFSGYSDIVEVNVFNWGYRTPDWDVTDATIHTASSDLWFNDYKSSSYQSGQIDSFRHLLLDVLLPKPYYPSDYTGTVREAYFKFEGSADRLYVDDQTIYGDWRVTLVNPIPVPAAVWLFGTALIGFIGISRRTTVN